MIHIPTYSIPSSIKDEDPNAAKAHCGPLAQKQYSQHSPDIINGPDVQTQNKIELKSKVNFKVH